MDKRGIGGGVAVRYIFCIFALKNYFVIMEELEHKSLPARFEVKAEDGKMMHICAYGAGIGNVDRVGDVIVSTAFDNWLASEGKKDTQFCYQHNYEQIIGKFDYDSFRVDEQGLYFEADLIPTSWGKDTEVLINEGLLKEFSISYYPVRSHYVGDADNGGVRYLDELEIREISIVTIPANPKAKLVSAKDTGTRQEVTPKPEDWTSKTDEELEISRTAIEQEIFNRVIAKI